MLAVLQFDGGSVQLIDRLIGEGRLPVLAELSRRGRRLPLEGTAGTLEGSLAVSVHTGLRASEHGLYFPFQWSPRDQRLVRREAFPQPEAIWDLLGRAGRRSLVIDPYDAVRPRSLRGAGICGWQLTNRMVMPRWSFPPDLYRRLSRRFGRASSGDEIFGPPRAKALVRVRTMLMDGARRLGDAAAELLAAERYDFAYVNLAATHVAGHQFWDVAKVIDLARLDPARRAVLETALPDVYEVADRALGQVVESLPDDADILVTTPNGMGPETERTELLPGMLAAVLGDGRPSARSGGAVWSVRGATPPGLRRAVGRVLPDRLALDLTARLSLAVSDWRTTRAFAVPCDPAGAVRLNVRGRERDGVVEPGEADDLIAGIREGLLSFRDSDGERSVAAVQRTAELEPPGPCLAVLPDLMVRWRDAPSSGVRSVSSPAFGEVTRASAGSGRSGNHREETWVITVGGASRPRSPGRPANIIDIAATAAELLGADRPGDGEPLLEPG